METGANERSGILLSGFLRLTNLMRRLATFILFGKRKGRECPEIRKFADVE